MILEGKTALVTGGSRGIGRAIALALARDGADIAFTYYRNLQAAEETAAAIQREGRCAIMSQVSLADVTHIERLFEEIRNTWGRLDIFVSNAVSATLRPVLELSLRHWEHVLSVNLTAFLECSRRSVQLMSQGAGRIIAISSLGSRRCVPGYAALGVAKAGIEALARYLAVELAEKDISVNVVCPGIVETQALQAFAHVVPDLEHYKQSVVERTPAKRMGLPEDVAGIVAFLCSPQAGWIRGQTIIADGGLSLTQM